MPKLRIFGFLLVLPVFPGVVNAQEDDGNSRLRYEIGLFSGFRSGGGFEDAVTGEALDVDEGASGGVILRIPQSSRKFIEIFYSEQSTRTEGGGLFTGDPLFDMDVRYFHLGGVYELDDVPNRPYVLATVGATRFEPKGNSLRAETRLSLGLGAGYLIPVTRNAALRFEARAIGTAFNSSSELFCTNGRCRLTFDSDALWQTEVSLTFALAF